MATAPVPPNPRMQPTGRSVPSSARVLIAAGDQWNVGWCGRGRDRPPLMRISLGGHDKLSLPPIKSGDEAAGLGIAQMRVLHFRALEHCPQDSFEG